MLPLPPVDPPIGLCSRVRLARDYYVRVDTVDYSVDPHYIGRFVDVIASLSTVTVVCDGQVIARHQRSWAKQGVISDPFHVATAAVLRREYRERREAHQRHVERQARQHADGHTVILRALPDYDALFGVDFTPAPPALPAAAPNPEATPS